MDNQETLLSDLDEFENNGSQEISESLERLLQHIARTGETLFPWIRLKSLFKYKLLKTMEDFYEEYPVGNSTISHNIEVFNYFTMKQKILDQLESFSNAPFTIQRLCELITEPKKHYTRADKFMRGIEKNILVVSTNDYPRHKRADEQHLVNGVAEHWISNDSLNGNSNHILNSNCIKKAEDIEVDEPSNKMSTNGDINQNTTEMVKSPDQEDMDTSSLEDDFVSDNQSDSKPSVEGSLQNENVNECSDSNHKEIAESEVPVAESDNNEILSIGDVHGTIDQSESNDNQSIEEESVANVNNEVTDSSCDSCEVSDSNSSDNVACSVDNRRKLDDVEVETNNDESESKKRKLCETDSSCSVECDEKNEVEVAETKDSMTSNDTSNVKNIVNADSEISTSTTMDTADNTAE